MRLIIRVTGKYAIREKEYQRRTEKFMRDDEGIISVTYSVTEEENTTVTSTL
jgi:hypothetical protein